MQSDQDLTTMVLATDSFLVGDGLEAILANVPDITIVGRVRTMAELVESIDEVGPDAVLICVRSQVVTTTAVVSAVRHLRLADPSIGIVVISDRVNEFALEVLRGGTTGIAFLLDEKLPDVQAVIDAVRGSRTSASLVDPSIVGTLIRRGDAVGIDDLTPREVDILEQMSQGMSNRGIAEALNVSLKSIERGVTAIFFKLGPFNQGLSDRRVSSSLVFLRSQTDPFRSSGSSESRGPLVLLEDEGLAAGVGG